MEHDITETAWNVDAVRRLDSLFQYIEYAIQYATETNRILATCPMR